MKLKGFILTLILAVASVGFAQDSTSVTPYVAGGLSMSNNSGSSFAAMSYPSIEAGVMVENLTFGAVFGRNNLSNLRSNSLKGDFWYEGKVAYAFPLGYVDGYGVFGIGNYIGTKTLFIEYGLGISKSFTDHFGMFIQCSNWDNAMYVTPGISFTF